MARLTYRNGVVVSVADDRVDRFLTAGFSRVEDKPKKAPAKKAAATPAPDADDE